MGVLLLLIGPGCTDDGSPDGQRTPATETRPTSVAGDSGQSGVHYMLVTDPAWELREAIDYRAGLGPMGERDPDLDWYAEYDGPRVDQDDGSYTIPHLAIFGHTAGLEKRRDQLPGFDFNDDDIGSRAALIATPADGNPAIVVVELATDYAVTLLTYDDGVDLRDLAARLVAVDEEQWIEAGGTMLDCVPLEPDCAP